VWTINKAVGARIKKPLPKAIIAKSDNGRNGKKTRKKYKLKGYIMQRAIHARGSFFESRLKAINRTRPFITART
jgi:hypothetical protein